MLGKALSHNRSFATIENKSIFLLCYQRADLHSRMGDTMKVSLTRIILKSTLTLVWMAPAHLTLQDLEPALLCLWVSIVYSSSALHYSLAYSFLC